jgi:predicted TIM-barrel fold metal-dependent hydrolase
MSPKDPRLEPFYRKCVELDIPFMSQAFASFYSYLPARVNQPILFEEPMMRHPELRVILFHGGYPWIEEAIMMTRRFPNCYLMPSVLYPTSSWVNQWDPTMVFPSWGPALTDYARTVGSGKIIYGSNFPVTDPVAQIRELTSLKLGKEAEDRILRQNAERVFRL